MPEFIIYRHDRGRPDADKRPVARVQASSAEDACRIAAGQVTLDANQHLSAEPAEPADTHEADLNRTSRALSRETLPEITEPAP
jgi:hypothetical protein